MYELCAQDDELWTISAVRASFADDRRIQTRFGIIAAKTARVPNLLQPCGISKAIGTI